MCRSVFDNTANSIAFEVVRPRRDLRIELCIYVIGADLVISVCFFISNYLFSITATSSCSSCSTASSSSSNLHSFIRDDERICAADDKICSFGVCISVDDDDTGVIGQHK